MAQRIIALFSSLTGRIFAAFWLSLCLVTLIVSHLPNLNPRNFHNVPQKQQIEMAQRFQTWIGQWQFQTTNPYRQLEKWNKHNQEPHFFFVNTNGELLRSLKQPSRLNNPRQRALNNFIAMSNNPMQPMQRVYGRRLISGPYLLILPEPNPAIWVYASQTWHPQSSWKRLLHQPITLLLLTMIVSIPFLLWLAWAIAMPARRLQQAAQRVANGERIQDSTLEKGPTELKAAGKQFNQMVKVVDETLMGQQRLLSDISHELRSPLTRLQMAAALAVRKQGDSPELQRIQTESERLEQLISQVLTLSRQQSISPTIDTISVSELWQDLLDDAQFEAEQKGKTFAVSTLPNQNIQGDPFALNSALENVIRNAIKYANHNIRLDINTRSNNLYLTLNDDGIGIPESEWENIFRPFYRVSEARDRDTGGTGLGLAIAQQIIHQHKGEIHLEQSDLGGARVCISLPLSAQS